MESPEDSSTTSPPELPVGSEATVENGPGPIALALFAVATTGIFGVGVRVGYSRTLDEERAHHLRRVGALRSAPSTLALRAFGLATVLCLSTVSLGCLGIGHLMGVYTPQAFTDRMRSVLPPYAQSLRSRLEPGLRSVRGAIEEPFQRMGPIVPRRELEEDEAKEFEAFFGNGSLRPNAATLPSEGRGRNHS